MKYRTLGRTGVQASCLGLGTSSFGRDIDQDAVAYSAPS
jgi:aryl-alcohol dehydrogenase-like predicted oxidoreductase